MPYFHIDIESQQVSKRAGAPCGDTFLVRRNIYHTTIILADGIGSGVKAHIASRMNSARLEALLDGQMSLRDAFFGVAGTMSRWRDHSLPFSAFLVMRVLNDGAATVLSYEMPPCFLISRREVSIVSGQPLVVQAGLASEAHFSLEKDEGVLLLSDGIIQSGLGRSSLPEWGVDGVESFLSARTGRDLDFSRITEEVLATARYNDGAHSGDDKTVLLAHSRAGIVVNILTGPPADKRRDREVAEAFDEAGGLKVICGATTADIFARHNSLTVEVEQRPVSYSSPPRYFLSGIDIVTEGAVTLTQAYNLLADEGESTIELDRSPAGDLASMLRNADFIRFTVGLARNPANADVVYRKQGILARDRIVPLLAEKLERMGKLVTVEFV